MMPNRFQPVVPSIIVSSLQLKHTWACSSIYYCIFSNPATFAREHTAAMVFTDVPMCLPLVEFQSSDCFQHDCSPAIEVLEASRLVCSLSDSGTITWTARLYKNLSVGNIWLVCGGVLKKGGGGEYGGIQNNDVIMQQGKIFKKIYKGSLVA